MDLFHATAGGLGFEGWITLTVLAGIIGGLVMPRYPAEMVLMAGLLVLMLSGVLTPNEAFADFANPAVVTVGLLYVVATGLRETGALALATNRMLGRPKTQSEAVARVIAPVTIASAFINNTPIVAMFLPVLADWCKKANVSPGRVFMPLSFAAILGGMCTLIGTSTNLVVNGLMTDAGEPTMNMFTLSPVGVPVALVGLLYILLANRWLLPKNEDKTTTNGDLRQYTTAVQVRDDASIIGRTIEGAGLRRLPGLFLVRIERMEKTLVAVRPDETLHGGDVLVFVGALESVVDLRRIAGLEPTSVQVANDRRTRPSLIEAVVAPGSPLAGQTLRDGAFRTHYGAAVVAVHRQGERIEGKIGDIRLRPGDALLLEAGPEFVERFRDSTDFYVVSQRLDALTLRHEQAPASIAILLALIGLITWQPGHTVTFALLAAIAMVAFGCCTSEEARRSVDIKVLVAIGATFGVGRAIESSGVAQLVGGSLIGDAGQFGPVALLSAAYLVTALFTSIITNNAAAILAFPLVAAAARANGLPLLPFAICVAIAASAGFSTPLGYQTNLMVMGPGRYRTADFLRFGAPLTAITGVVCVVTVALVFGL